MKTAARCLILVLFVCGVSVSTWAASAVTTNTSDAPWKIHETVRASYPPRLMYKGVTRGEARVRVSISATGQLLDALVVGSTFRDFGDEALRTVKMWRFDPEKVNGEPVGVVGDITFLFTVDGPVAIDKKSPAPNESPEEFTDPAAYRAEGLKRLDHIPAPTHVVAPAYPKEWSDRGLSGTVTVEFFIDETGRARIPVVTSADHGLLGASAVAAVAQWKFEPPTCQGRPVLAHIEQIFTFQPEKK